MKNILVTNKETPTTRPSLIKESLSTLTLQQEPSIKITPINKTIQKRKKLSLKRELDELLGIKLEKNNLEFYTIEKGHKREMKEINQRR